jgi:type IV pilus biogenesis protein PilP
MSSFRCLRKSRINFAATAALFAIVVAAPAVAQQAPQVPQLPNAAPLALPGDVNGGPIRAVAPEKGLPVGATLSDADQRVRAMAAEASRDLDDLASGALSSARENNDVNTKSIRSNQIMDLDHQIAIAEKSKKLWTILNGEESEKEGEIKELEAKVSALTAEKEALAKRAEAASLLARQTVANPDPDPVVSSVMGAAGNARAEVLVPYSGRFTVKVGDTLPNGQKVVSIGSNGVTVSKDGERKVLSFGDSVPSVRPARNASQMSVLSQ